jgi:hypothetical protein
LVLHFIGRVELFHFISGLEGFASSERHVKLGITDPVRVRKRQQRVSLLDI